MRSLNVGDIDVLLRSAFAALQCGAFLVAPLLPVEIGWENGFLENLQTIILVLGAIWALWCWHACDSPRIKALWLTLASIWLVLALRELGWGVVFLEPLSHSNETGPVFSSSVQLWYRPAVVPGLAAVVFIWVWSFFATRQGVTIMELVERKALPLTEVIIVVALMVFSAAAEGHMGLSSGLMNGSAQIYEELIELFAYLALLMSQFRIIQGTRR